jgi:hypothetical protein
MSLTAWLNQNLSWLVPMLMAGCAWMLNRVEKVLAQVRKINGQVALHQQWMTDFEELTEARRQEIGLKISGLEDRERDRLQAEVVLARAAKRIKR